MQRSSPTPPIHVTLVNLGRVVEAKGGVEKVFCELANNLLSFGFIVNAVCCDRQQGRPGFPLSEDANFHNCWEDNRNLLLSRPICNLRSVHPNRNIRRIQRTRLLDKMYQAKLQPHLSSIKTDIWICFQPESAYVIKELLKMPQPAITMFHQNPKFFIQNPESQLFHKTIEENSILQVLMPEYVAEFKKNLTQSNYHNHTKLRHPIKNHFPTHQQKDHQRRKNHKGKASTSRSKSLLQNHQQASRLDDGILGRRERKSKIRKRSSRVDRGIRIRKTSFPKRNHKQHTRKIT